MPVRVLHITAAYPTERNPRSGVFIKTQVESLRMKGIVADVCVLEGKGFTKYLSGIRQVQKQLRMHTYDVLHAHYMYTGWTARLASRLPLIVSYMGSDVLGTCDDNGRYAFGSRAAHVFFSNVLSLLTRHTIVKSRGLASLFLTKNKSVIPNGVDLTVFRPMPPDRSLFGLDEKKRYILFAGQRGTPIKRYPLAQKAMALVETEFPSASMIIAENKKPEQMALLMNSVDCLLLTSAHEGSPNVVKEALACNLPVVSVDVGDVRDRLTEIGNCYIAEDVPSEIAEAVCRVLRSPRRVSGGFEKLHSLRLDIIAEKILTLYASAIEKVNKKEVVP